jgi:hypothetical protein
MMTSEVRVVKIKWLTFWGASLLLSVFFAAKLTLAQGANISFHGFGQGNYTSNLSSANPDNGDFKWAGERFQLKLDASLSAFRSFAKVDAFYDHIDNEAELELREGFVDYASASWDLRVGRQIITWGLGDLIFINDVFPKDYEAFFSGRPLEYLKKGMDGARIGLYPSFTSIELIAIPFFEPNNFPQQNRFWMFDPLPGLTNREEKEPTTSFRNTEFAARLYRDVAGFDASLYFYKGFFRQPWVMPDHPTMPTKLTLFYPKLSVYGASLQGSGWGGVLSLEAGYYDSRQDGNGADPLVPNSQTRFLIGYQRQLWHDFTIGLQYYGEYMHDYAAYERSLPSGFPKEDRLRQLTVSRLTQFLVHQTLRFSFFSFYSPSDGDYQLNPEVKYNFSDHIWTAVGANVFGGGESWSQLGQFDKNDNVYLQLRYEF